MSPDRSSAVIRQLGLALLLLTTPVLAAPAGPLDALRAAASGLAEPQAKATQEALDAAAAADRDAAALTQRLEALHAEVANAPANLSGRPWRTPSQSHHRIIQSGANEPDATMVHSCAKNDRRISFLSHDRERLQAGNTLKKSIQRALTPCLENHEPSDRNEHTR